MESERGEGAPPATPRPLRIGLVCPYSVGVPGGVQGQVMGLARALRRMGHEARVLAPCDGPPPATWVTPLGNSIPTAANGSVAPVAPDPACALRTIRAIRDEAFDVLHLHEPMAPSVTVTALIVDLAPAVGTFHAAGATTPYRFLTSGARYLADRLDARIAVSKDAKDLVNSYLPAEYEVLFNGVEVDRYRHAEPFVAAGPTIFFCGRHEERKGLSVLLDAMAMLPPQVTCWVASDGPETAALKAIYGADPRIEWLGRVSDEDKIARLKGATVFCAPSLRGESFGVVLIEAMAAGTPVVASALAGYQNVATDGDTALLVAPGDVNGLADALGRVLFDTTLAERLRQAGDRRADDFSMAKLAERYVEIYRHVIATHRTNRRTAGQSASQRWRGRMMRVVSTWRDRVQKLFHRGGKERS